MDFDELAELRHLDHDDRDDRPCPECGGRGYLTVDSGGAGPAYHCPDCTEYYDDEEENGN